MIEENYNNKEFVAKLIQNHFNQCPRCKKEKINIDFRNKDYVVYYLWGCQCGCIINITIATGIFKQDFGIVVKFSDFHITWIYNLDKEILNNEKRIETILVSCTYNYTSYNTKENSIETIQTKLPPLPFDVAENKVQKYLNLK